MTKARRTVSVCAALVLAIVAACFGADEVITNYFAGYVFIPASFTNAGDTGLSVSNAYLCIPHSILSANITTTQAATATGDVRAVMYSINQEFYESYIAKASTNRSASIPDRTASYAASGTNINETVYHAIKTIRRVGSATLP